MSQKAGFVIEVLAPAPERLVDIVFVRPADSMDDCCGGWMARVDACAVREAVGGATDDHCAGDDELVFLPNRVIFTRGAAPGLALAGEGAGAQLAGRAARALVSSGGDVIHAVFETAAEGSATPDAVFRAAGRGDTTAQDRMQVNRDALAFFDRGGFASADREQAAFAEALRGQCERLRGEGQKPGVASATMARRAKPPLSADAAKVACAEEAARSARGGEGSLESAKSAARIPLGALAMLARPFRKWRTADARGAS